MGKKELFQVLFLTGPPAENISNFQTMSISSESSAPELSARMPRSLSIAVTLKKGDIIEKDGSKILPLKEEIMAAYPNDWKERKFRGKVVKINNSSSLEVVWIVNGAEHRLTWKKSRH